MFSPRDSHAASFDFAPPASQHYARLSRLPFFAFEGPEPASLKTRLPALLSILLIQLVRQLRRRRAFTGSRPRFASVRNVDTL